jgi:hypothetical protein
MHSVPRGAVAPTWVCRAVDIYRGSTWGDVADELLAVAQEPHSWDAFCYGDEPPADPTRGAASGPFRIVLHLPPGYPDAERIHGIVAEYMGAMVRAIGIGAAFWRLCEAAGDGLIAANCALSPLMEESIDASCHSPRGTSPRHLLGHPRRVVRQVRPGHALRSVRGMGPSTGCPGPDRLLGMTAR